ncbi:MAG: hypothetical protein EO766_11740 [Hydrotalea sp. AMD]|uniref:class II aldolase/adducin family protein n=1 Tax=Hydrotalea sp. AMD TaxID=2501297 RepID=UPI0010255E0D|nr:class II aldolase/adducin family protein [Hydrotalea sp. AMD]RWZ87196.1 MAG: hypothetical protein EO766_11740 [Hydrotalea sp. AMD]
MKKIHIIGGGTISHVRNHLSLIAPAWGTTARQINRLIENWINEYEYKWDYNNPIEYDWNLHLTKVADYESKLVTNEDVEHLVDQLIADPDTKVIFFNAAMCDYDGSINNQESGKYADRLKTTDGYQTMLLRPSAKIIKKIRRERKDIFLVAFKTTTNATEDEQYIAGLNLLKENSCNLVLANDTVTRTNMIICPEEARYCVTTNRDLAINTLVDMTMKRQDLHFTRSTVIEGPSVDWNDPEVPESLREVVNYCIEKGAYKPFRGATAGHFAVKVDDQTFLTSKRSTDFNKLNEIGLVKVVSSGPDEVIAYGAKPSVGGQSQRIIFAEHEDVDCIVHFHCPPKNNIAMPIKRMSQYPYECGSHECGQNTSNGLSEIWKGIKAVYLDEHGPNVVFNRTADPKRIIRFIETFFDLSEKTGGPVWIQ